MAHHTLSPQWVYAPRWFYFISSGRVGNCLFVICIKILERRLPSRVTAFSHAMRLFHTFIFTFQCQLIILTEAVASQSLHCSEWLCVPTPCKRSPFPPCFYALWLLFSAIRTHIIYLLCSFTPLSFFVPPSLFSCPVVSSNVVQSSLSAWLWYWSVDHHTS